eukprot:scaffold51711_cov18-Prasinocladus_malaysianus.AAC.2
MKNRLIPKYVCSRRNTRYVFHDTSVSQQTFAGVCSSCTASQSIQRINHNDVKAGGSVSEKFTETAEQMKSAVSAHTHRDCTKHDLCTRAAVRTCSLLLTFSGADLRE